MKDEPKLFSQLVENASCLLLCTNCQIGTIRLWFMCKLSLRYGYNLLYACTCRTRRRNRECSYYHQLPHWVCHLPSYDGNSFPFLKRNSNFLLICALMCIFGCEFKLKVRLPTSTSSLLIYFLPFCHKFLIVAIKTHN
jgi:hypothetical protein